MESAIAKYDHVVQCLRELKQIYRNAEMSETVLSPHTDNFTHSGLYLRSHAIYKSSQKRQSFSRVVWWKAAEVWFLKGLCPNNCLWSNSMLKSCFHTGMVGLVQTWVDPAGLLLLVLELIVLPITVSSKSVTMSSHHEYRTRYHLELLSD